MGTGLKSPDSGESSSGQQSDPGGVSPSLMQSIAQLVKIDGGSSMSAQSLPPLKHYSGEGVQSLEDGFDRFIEQFEERARIVGWSEEHRKYIILRCFLTRQHSRHIVFYQIQ